jgi:hypothetical protein
MKALKNQRPDNAQNVLYIIGFMDLHIRVYLIDTKC